MYHAFWIDRLKKSDRMMLGRNALSGKKIV